MLVDSGGHAVVDINTNTVTNFSNGIVAGARNTVGSGTLATDVTDVTNSVDARGIGATSVDQDGLSGFLSVPAATCATP